jgi:hypothetical protein
VRARLVALLAVAVVAPALAPTTAVANLSAKKAIWGPVTRAGKSEFPLYHRLGVKIYETSLYWENVAPTRPLNPTDPADPAYQWPADMDYAIRQASRYHMRVMIEVGGAPQWANGGRAWNYPPTEPGSFAQFLTAAARHYPSAHLWMIWGEPDRQANFAPMRPAPVSAHRLTKAQAVAPHIYARLLDASYGALKAVSKRNLVIGGNTFTWGKIPTRLWIENLRLPDGRPPRMDLYGHNPFCLRHPSLANPPSRGAAFDFSDLGRLYRLVNRYLDRGSHPIKLFLSEWTIPTSPHDSEFNYWVAPRVAAQWIKDAWRIVLSSSFIYALGWIHVYDDPPGQGTSGGLFNYRGHPKPEYYAFRNG